MKKTVLAAFIAAIVFPAMAGAQNSKVEIRPYGFIRNFFAFDTRESIAGTEDLFYYVPKDVALTPDGDDINANANFKFAALTSRLGFDVVGYEYNGWKMAAKIEADFYNGLSSTSSDPLTKSSLTGTANFRLRQAFVTVANDKWAFKAGQAWHPMAADMPDVFSLNTGAPFGPFSRTPLVSAEYNFTPAFSTTLATIWQQQYTSTGPFGASANYIRNGGCEWYLGLNFKADDLLVRVGADALWITPRTAFEDAGKMYKVDEHIMTMMGYIYAQYKVGGFTAKLKTTLAQAGEHVCLNGGYGVHDLKEDGSGLEYTPTLNSSSWISLQYKLGNWQYILFGGYVKNFGTCDNLAPSALGKPVGFYFSKNSYDNMNAMWRLTPTLIRNFGKLALGIEYELTTVTYGDKSLGMNLEKGLYDQGLHNVSNHRIQTLVKFTF